MTAHTTRRRRTPAAESPASPADARAILDSAISEKAFQAQVIQLAELNGWMVYHTFDSRRSAKGFPDLVLVRYTHHPCLIFAELKTERGRVSVAQSVWIRAFQVVAAKCPTVLGVFVWRPSMWAEIERALGIHRPVTVDPDLYVRMPPKSSARVVMKARNGGRGKPRIVHDPFTDDGKAG